MEGGRYEEAMSDSGQPDMSGESETVEPAKPSAPQCQPQLR